MSRPAEPIGSDDDCRRQERIRQLISECLIGRAAGAPVSDQALIEAHPDLLPELADELRKLQLIEDAKRFAKTSQAPPGPDGLRIRCPHCQNPVEVVDDSSLSGLNCPTCGSQFSLVDESDQSFQAGQLEYVNHFQLLDKVGIGAFGSVWSAKDTQLDRIVALKIPRKGQMTAEDQEQFIREARAAAQLKHPNIVSVLEVGRHEDRIYIACEFVQGLDLADWLTDQQATPREAAELCATLADALQHAHDHGVIHRDIKPSNIMLDLDGKPHLMDFGLAKREAGEMTMTVEGKLLGTPAYMPPEQARGSAHDADARSDIYSLGVILFELCTGERPFRGSTRMLLHQVLTEDAPAPRRLNSSIPKDLETICLKCLEKDPDRRYPTSAALRDDLQRFLRGEPVHARPISQVDRAWRWCRRKPLIAGLSAAITSLILLLAVAGPLVASRQAALRSLEAEARVAASSAQRRAEAEAERFRYLLYASDMRTAQTDLLAGDVDSTLTLLNRHVPQDGELDQRGFEWYHLWQRCRRSVLTPSLQTKGMVRDVLLSDDGKTITSSSFGHDSDSTFVDINRWHADTYEKLYSRAIEMRAFSAQRLSPDGQTVAIGRKDGRVNLVNFVTDERSQLTGLQREVLAIAFSPDGSLIAAGDSGGKVWMWDVFSRQRAVPIEPHADDVYCLTFSPDGKMLATGSRDSTARLWDTVTGESLKVFDLTSVCKRRSSVWSLDFSSDGRLLATGTSGDHVVLLWDVPSGELLHNLDGHENYVPSVRFAPDGKSVASASGDRKIRIWNVQNGELLEVLPDNGFVSYALAFFSNGKRLICQGASEYKDLRIWSLDEPSGVTILAGHHDNVNDVCYSPDGRYLATASTDKTVILWDTEQDKRRTLRGHQGAVTAIDFSPAGNVLASGSRDRSIVLWDVSSGTSLRTITRPSEVEAIAFSPRGALVAGHADGTAALLDPASGELTAELSVASNRAVRTLEVLGDGDMLATGAFEYFSVNLAVGVKLWDLRSSQLIKTVGDATVWVLAYSPKSRVLAIGLFGQRAVLLVNADTLEEIRRLRIGSETRAMAFTPCGTRLISTGATIGDVKFWSVADGRLLYKFSAHRDGIYSVTMSPDGRTLVTAAADETVKLWQAATDQAVEGLRQRWIQKQSK